ncbi:STAS domain-containing protein [Pseudoneobacillus sp. C159]
MKEELRYIGKKIIENDLAIAKSIAMHHHSKYTKELNEAGSPLTERLDYRRELIHYFGQALYGDIEIVTKNIEQWSIRGAELAIQYEVPLAEALRAISAYRTVIWDVFTEELEQKHFAAITMLDVSKIIDPLIDQIFGIYGEIFEKHNQQLIKVANTALDERSVPVVPIVNDIAVIPLVGEIDIHRSKLIMEVSLSEGDKLSLSCIIFDLSGVPMLDTIVADQFFKIAQALELIGIKVIFTGVRPEIAQTIIKLGLDFTKIKTYSHLQQALIEKGFCRQI